MESASLVLQVPLAVAVLVDGWTPVSAPVQFAPAAPDAHSHAPPESTPRAPRGPPLSSFVSIV